MAVNDIETILLRESLAAFFPGFPTVIRPTDTKRAFDGGAVPVAMGRGDPGLTGIILRHGYRESETGRAFGFANILPVLGAVGGSEDTAVILLPKDVGIGRGGDEDMRVVAHIGGRVGQPFGTKPLVPYLPAPAAVRRFKDAGAAYTDVEMVLISWVYDDGVDPRLVAAAAKPARFTGRMFPERLDEPEIAPAVFAKEETAGVGTYPKF